MIEVADGSVSTVSPPDPGDLFTSPVTEPPAIEELFGKIQNAINRRADSFEADYDQVLSYPTSVSVDYEKRAIDDESILRGGLVRAPGSRLAIGLMV